MLAQGIVVFAHGSSIESANETVHRVARELALRLPGIAVEAAFLELGRPDLATAVSRLTARGASAIRVLPYFLTPGVHLQRDLPALIEEIQRAHRETTFLVAPPLEGHPALIQILVDRAEEYSPCVR